MNKLIIFLAMNILLFGGYGLQVGAYEDKSNVPVDIDFGVDYKILKSGEYYKLVLGPFESKEKVEIFQEKYGVDGFVIAMSDNKQRDLKIERASKKFTLPKQKPINFKAKSVQHTPSNFTNQTASGSFGVEILTAKDKKNIPPRIIKRVASLGFNPIFILDKGLFRLVVGPYSTMSSAQRAKAKIEMDFGRSVYVLNFSSGQFEFASDAMNVVPRNQSLDIVSTDSNEHIGYLEQQRSKVNNKYNNNPFVNNRETFIERDPSRKKQSGLQPMVDARKKSILQERKRRADKEKKKNTPKSKAGVFFGVSISSSRNSLMVNGNKIEGSFLKGLTGGYKMNPNTMIGISYFLPETKTNKTAFVKDANSSAYNVYTKSKYEYMISAFVKYKHFLPSNDKMFITAKFGASITKQIFSSQQQFLGGKGKSSTQFYTDGILGFGVGYNFTKIANLSLSYDTYFNTRKITSATRINLIVGF